MAFQLVNSFEEIDFLFYLMGIREIIYTKLRLWKHSSTLGRIARVKESLLFFHIFHRYIELSLACHGFYYYWIVCTHFFLKYLLWSSGGWKD